MDTSDQFCKVPIIHNPDQLNITQVNASKYFWHCGNFKSLREIIVLEPKDKGETKCLENYLTTVYSRRLSLPQLNPRRPGVGVSRHISRSARGSKKPYGLTSIICTLFYSGVLSPIFHIPTVDSTRFECD